MPVLNTQIETVKQVLNGRQISGATESQLSKTLIYIYSLIGLRMQHFPNAIEDKILFSFIRAEYSSKTLEEFILAFKLAIKDELDLEDIKVYDQFTCEYLARVMTAYSKWLKKVNKEIPAPVPQITFKTIITTPEEKLSDIQEWEEKKDVQVKFIPPYLYEYLIEFGKISPTVGDKWEAMGKATDLRKSELYEESLNLRIESVSAYKNFLEMYTNGEYKGAEIERIKTLSKKIMVFDYLNVQNESRKQAL